MQDALDQLLDKLAAIWQRRWWIVVVSWLICVVGWAVVHNMPNQYQARARVFVDTETILKPLLADIALQSDMEGQVELLFKNILSRTNVEKIVRLSDLDLGVSSEREFDELVNALEGDIKVLKLDKKQNLYQLTYSYKNPEQAKRVLDATINVMMESFLGQSRTDSKSAQEFIEREISEYEQRLLTEDRKMAEFKRANGELLPGDAGGVYQRLESERKLLEASRLELQEREGQLNAARATLQGDKSQVAVPSAVAVSRFDERIAALQQRLDDVSLRFTDNHPDIIELKQLIKDLERQRTQELENYSRKSSPAPLPADNAYLNELQLLVSQLDSQVASLRIRVANYQQRVATLEADVARVPAIEAEFVALRRGYDITRSKYDDLLARREQASLAQRAEDQQDGLKFRIIDQARALPEPVGPPRLMLLTAVLFAGLAAGLGAAFLLGEFSPRVYRSATLVRLTGIPLLGEVTDARPVVRDWMARFGMVLFAGLLLTLLMLYLGQLALLLAGGSDMLLQQLRSIGQGGG